MEDLERTVNPSPDPTDRVATLRMWPAITLVIIMWLCRLGPGMLDEVPMPLMMAQFMGPTLCSVLVLLWWLFFSRATRVEKFAGLFGFAALLFVANSLADKSVKGFLMILWGVPWGVTAFALVLCVVRNLAPPRRALLGLLAAAVGLGYWDLVRTDVILGDFETTRNWRWVPSPEEITLQRLARRDVSSVESALAPLSPTIELAEWPDFRGPNRDGRMPDVRLSEDWDTTPPRELWRIPVGPAWSSFSVAGDRIFTQEQRDQQEVVVCYDARTGGELWAHEYPSRFWEVVGGAGPRATPTLSAGRLFSLGANGVLLCLDAISGEVIWEQDISQDADRSPPQWGFSASPLVTNEVVVVHAGGSGDKGVLAYDAATGEPRWQVASGNHSYSSPQLSEVCGRSCLLMLTNEGLTIVDPADGAELFDYQWPYEGYRVVQPLVVAGSSVLLGSPMGTGTRRIDLTLEADEFSAEDRWTSLKMSPYYNDYVAHDGFLYGFDNNIFACVDLESGKRQWKQGRYGNGQVLLLPDAGQLLVISEDGELVLLRATPEEHVELAKYRALEGRTWNHPVLVQTTEGSDVSRARLFVRNAEEAACFELAMESSVE